jgi:transcriptional regulator with XRE-family HTH domain
MNHSKPLADLDARRRRLGMSAEILAQRSVLSRQTVHRVLAGGSASFQNVIAIADVLGMSHSFSATKSAPDIREQQAEAKARALVGMVQATCGLESQAVDQEHLDEMVRQTVHELLAGPNRRLWAA